MKRLIPQSKKLIQEMISAGYPICLSAGDWGGNHQRHCNACIEMYRRHIQSLKNVEEVCKIYKRTRKRISKKDAEKFWEDLKVKQL
jgi:ABC-type polysaccharide/polyol phosphate transport system ATPase subunit